MGLFGKKDGDAPPDVGQEEKYDESKGIAGGITNEVPGGDKSEMPALDSGAGSSGGSSLPTIGGGGVNNFQVEKIEARVDSVVDWIKQFYERFSYISESIGEIRTMNLANEKRISASMAEAERVIDVVKEIKPEELRVSYQKTEMKVATLAEKIEANTQFMNEVMNEMNELRRKSEVFIGTEGIMKLNEDTKKELIGIQKLASVTKMQADKAQEIFMELRKGFAESQKVSAVMTNLDESYSGLKGSIEALKVDHSKVVGRSDYLDFKKSYDTKLLALRNNIAEVESMKEVVTEMQNLVETSLNVSRRNEEDIAKVASKVGAEDVKGISDYENQVVELVEIIDKLSTQVAELRKERGMKADKVVIPKKAADKVVIPKKTTVGVVSKVPGKVAEAEKPLEEGAVEAKPKILKPSESEEVVKKLKEIEVPEVPKLKAKEFLGKKNHLVTNIEESEERARKKIAPIEKKFAEATEKVIAEKPEKLPKAKGVFSKKLGSMLKKVGETQMAELPKLKSKKALEEEVLHGKKKKLIKKKATKRKKKVKVKASKKKTSKKKPIHKTATKKKTSKKKSKK